MGSGSALDTYEAYAPIYNAVNYLNDYEMWLGRTLLPELERHGLEGDRALDVACGTGRAFGPLLRRGWRVRGCDLSPSMLEWARREGDGRVELDTADMRELPVYGEFELVLCLNDSINYLLGDDELRRSLAGMRANLAAGGLVLFDVNSRSTYEGDGSWARGSSKTVECDGRRWTWRASGEVEPSVHEVRIDGDDVNTLVNRQRFRSAPEVLEAMAASGLECRAVLGMEEVGGKVLLSEPPDEDRHYKVVYIAAKSEEGKEVS
ncbi:MAG TPA: class I SAM-dependent methyltransferase [Solirubrobacterales bacterium]|jgi:SAM-dependent methyltransferase